MLTVAHSFVLDAVEIVLLGRVGHKKQHCDDTAYREHQHGDSIHFASSFRRNNKLSFQSSWYGLPHINPHAFRHTEASVLLANGTDIVTVAAQLGHASANTTENFYAHIIEENKARASECIADVLLRKKA